MSHQDLFKSFLHSTTPILPPSLPIFLKSFPENILYFCVKDAEDKREVTCFSLTKRVVNCKCYPAWAYTWKHCSKCQSLSLTRRASGYICVVVLPQAQTLFHPVTLWHLETHRDSLSRRKKRPNHSGTGGSLLEASKIPGRCQVFYIIM